MERNYDKNILLESKELQDKVKSTQAYVKCKEAIEKIIEKCTKCKTNSYYLKHVVEDYYAATGKKEYISNDALIVVCDELGYKTKESNCQNVLINCNVLFHNNKQIQPDGSIKKMCKVSDAQKEASRRYREKNLKRLNDKQIEYNRNRNALLKPIVCGCGASIVNIKKHLTSKLHKAFELGKINIGE